MMRIGMAVSLMVAGYCYYIHDNLAGVFFMAMAMDFSLAMFVGEWTAPTERKLEELSNEVAQLKAALHELKAS